MADIMSVGGQTLNQGLSKPSRQVQVTEVKGGYILGGYGFGESEICVTLDEVKARLDSFFAPQA